MIHCERKRELYRTATSVSSLSSFFLPSSTIHVVINVGGKQTSSRLLLLFLGRTHSYRKVSLQFVVQLNEHDSTLWEGIGRFIRAVRTHRSRWKPCVSEQPMNEILLATNSLYRRVIMPPRLMPLCSVAAWKMRYWLRWSEYRRFKMNFDRTRMQYIIAMLF